MLACIAGIVVRIESRLAFACDTAELLVSPALNIVSIAETFLSQSFAVALVVAS